MSQKSIYKKAEIVSNISQKFQQADSIIIVDYRGLTAEEMTLLRKKLRNIGIEIKVIKNSILLHAAKKIGLSRFEKLFIGPTAVAFYKGDIITPAKILYQFSKECKDLEIKGGIIDGKISSTEEIIRLAELPSKEVLISMLLSLLQSPIRHFACSIKEIIKKEA